PKPPGKYFPWRMIYPLVPKFANWIARNIRFRKFHYLEDASISWKVKELDHEKNYDLIIARHLRYAAVSGVLNFAKRLIIDIDDNEIEYYKLLTRDPTVPTVRRLFLHWRVKVLERLLPELTSNVSELWVTKESDRTYPWLRKARVLPNIPYPLCNPVPPAPLPSPSENMIVLFVGMLSYIYNRKGIDWFLQKVWPNIQREERQAVFRIVGSRVREQDRERWSKVPGVEVVGYLERLEDAYRDCAIVIAPVHSGGGTSIKVLEALMYGRPCVATPGAARGFETLAKEGGLEIAQNDEEFSRKCINLLRDPKAREEISKRGWSLSAENYSFDSFRKIVLETLEKVVCRNSLCGDRPRSNNS
ncbi:MAG: glycosyltransferase, partial [Candidatus Kryptoniota bacterium]